MPASLKRQHGLTLLELLVVLAIIGFAMAGVSLALRDSGHTQLEREAQRLTAQLEAARAQSRTSGVALIWRATPDGYSITSAVASSGLSPRQETWLSPSTQAFVSTRAVGLTDTITNNTSSSTVLVLGPEPIMAPASITLTVSPNLNNTGTSSNAQLRQPLQQLRIATDGLRPFQVVP